MMSEIMSAESKIVIRDVGVLEFKPNEQSMLLKLCEKSKIQPLENVRIYGSLQEPYYIANDILTAVEGKATKYRNKGDYESSDYVVRIWVKQHSGKKLMVAFTEIGVITAIARSNTEISRRIMTYITIVIKQLMQNHIVTLESANKAFEAELEKQRLAIEDLKRKNDIMDILGGNLELENKKLKEQEANDIATIHKQQFTNRMLLQEHDISNKSIVQFLIRHNSKPVHIKIVSRPLTGSLKHEFDYELTDPIDDTYMGYIFTLVNGVKPTYTTAPPIEQKFDPNMSMSERFELNDAKYGTHPGDNTAIVELDKDPSSITVGTIYVHANEGKEVMIDLLTQMGCKIETKRKTKKKKPESKRPVKPKKKVASKEVVKFAGLSIADIKLHAHDRYFKVLAEWDAFERSHPNFAEDETLFEDDDNHRV